MTTTVEPDQAIEGTVVDDPQQPMDVIEAAAEQDRAEQDERPSRGVATRPAGSMDLTIRAEQEQLTGMQLAALTAVLNFDPKEVDAQPHVKAFLHVCAKRGLDPWMREAYLIARGKGQYRKFTMQIGIDGFRKGAAGTGRFIRKVETVWTGRDDDEKSYWFDKDAGVMRRIWFDQWPASRGNPGAARVTIEFYDEADNIVQASAQADWEMFAPYSDKYSGTYPNKSKVIGADGKPVQELNEMWTKGGPHMLAKCSEALLIRQTFPATFSGVYAHEEMHRLDQAEKVRQEAEQAVRRRSAFDAAHGQPAAVPAKPDDNVQDAEVVYDDAPAEPLIPVGKATPAEPEPTAETPPVEEPAAEPEAVPEPETDPEVIQAWLLDEVAMIADLLGSQVEQVCRRFMVRFKGNVEAFTIDQLREVVATLRPTAIDALRQAGRGDEADAYARVTPDQVGPMERLLGRE